MRAQSLNNLTLPFQYMTYSFSIISEDGEIITELSNGINKTGTTSTNGEQPCFRPIQSRVELEIQRTADVSGRMALDDVSIWKIRQPLEAKSIQKNSAEIHYGADVLGMGKAV